MKTWNEFVNERLKAVGQEKVVANHTRVEIACPQYGSAIYRHENLIIATYPPKRQYSCIECGWIGASY